MKVYTYIPQGYFGANMYLLNFSGKGVIIDPTVSFDRISEKLAKNGIEIAYILITHAHFDHFITIDDWVRNTKAKVCVGRLDAKALSDSRLNCYRMFFGEDKGYYGAYKAVSEGDTIDIDGNLIEVIETPGHTVGSVSFKIGDAVFVGDVVFAGNSIGRCDLPGGDLDTLIKSIRKIAALPENTKIYSGHGSTSYVKEIKTY
jgi:glyoxylase-like metal-dependent hydrolase (beta-lactamase superfamily II)